MKRLVLHKCFFAMVVALLVCLVSCQTQPSSPKQPSNHVSPTQTPVENTPGPHQQLIAGQAPFDGTDTLYFSIPEVGLQDVYICDASSDSVYLDQGIHGQVLLLGDDGKSRSSIAQHYLAVLSEGIIQVLDLSLADIQYFYGGSLEVRDIDGDRDVEILLQQAVGLVGGAGNYLSRVFDYQNGTIVERFSSDTFFQEHGQDLGFSITLLKDQQFTICNERLDYRETFTLANRDEDYFKWWYDVEGGISDRAMMVDTFCVFLPVDTDWDGVYEIACEQYASLRDHADGIGSVKTLLRYNQESDKFEIVHGHFDVYD